MNSARLFSYIVKHDTGFAPNPFFSYCTLACCKPRIRKSARVGDWVLGITSKQEGHRIVYFMRVDETLASFGTYWNDGRFTKKKPRFDSSTDLKCGDNIYEPDGQGQYRQLESTHSHRHPYSENLELKAKDLSGRQILISTNYTYYGTTGRELTEPLRLFIAGRGH